MAYKKYLKLSRTNFTMRDARNFFHAKVGLAFQYYLYICIYGLFLAAFLTGTLGRLFSEDPNHNILVIFMSFLLSFTLMGNICLKIHKKWADLASVFKEAQIQTCFQLELPLIVRKGGLDLASPSYRNPQNHCAVFLMPSSFEQEFLQLHREDTPEKLCFSLELDDKWIFQNTKECGIENIKQYSILN